MLTCSVVVAVIIFETRNFLSVASQQCVKQDRFQEVSKNNPRQAHNRLRTRLWVEGLWLMSPIMFFSDRQKAGIAQLALLYHWKKWNSTWKSCITTCLHFRISRVPKVLQYLPILAPSPKTRGMKRKAASNNGRRATIVSSTGVYAHRSCALCLYDS